MGWVGEGDQRVSQHELGLADIGARELDGLAVFQLQPHGLGIGIHQLAGEALAVAGAGKIQLDARIEAGIIVEILGAGQRAGRCRRRRPPASRRC